MEEEIRRVSGESSTGGERTEEGRRVSGESSTGGERTEEGRRVSGESNSSSECKRSEESILLEQTFRDTTPPELIDSLPEIASEISSGNEELEISATKPLLYLLKHGGPEAMETVIQHNNGFFVPHLLRLMKRRVSYAAKAVVVILRGTDDQAKVVMDNGGVASFAELLRVLDNDHLDHALIQQAVKGVEQIFSLSIAYRHEMVNLGAIPHLANILKVITKNPWGGPENVHEKSYQILHYGALALKNLVSAYPQDTLKLNVLDVLPVLMRLINMYIEHFSVIVAFACAALHSLTKGSVLRLRGILSAQLCQRIVFLLRDSGEPLKAAFDFTRTLLASPEAMVLANNGVLHALNHVLTLSKLHTQEDRICHIIYKFAYHGSSDRVQMIIDAELIGTLIQLFYTRQSNLELQRHVVCALAAMAMKGSYEQFRFMEVQGCLILICEYLDHADRFTRVLCFKALRSILELGEANKDNTGGVNIFAQMVSELRGFRTLYWGRLRKDGRYRVLVTYVLNRFDWQNYSVRNYE